MVGKYVQMRDSYISLNEALQHAGLKTAQSRNVHFVESTDVEASGTGRLDGMDAILVPGGFGERGIEGKIQAVRYAREKKIPYLGICLGMQVAADRVRPQRAGGWPVRTAPSSTAPRRIPVIAMITEWQDAARGRAAAQRGNPTSAAPCALGAQDVEMGEGTLAGALYGAEVIRERQSPSL